MYDDAFTPDPDLPPQEGPAPRPAPPQRTRHPKRGGWMGKLTLGIALLALVVACANLYLTLSDRLREEAEPPAPPEPTTFQYRDRTLVVKEGVPLNPYDPQGYSADGQGRIRYEKDGRQARAGIDVSFYQGEVDWLAVAGDGVDFAMIRLGYRGYTEGTLQMDSCFSANIQGALDAGLDVGVYFFSQAINEEEARQEANFVVEALSGYNITYPVAFDWEPIAPGKGARTDGMDGQTLTACAAAFCQEIARAGYAPAVYFNQDQGYLTYDLSQLSQYALWLADYDSAPDFYYHFDLWQYTHSGSVAGIQGAVDWDLDFGPVNAP